MSCPDGAFGIVLPAGAKRAPRQHATAFLLRAFLTREFSGQPYFELPLEEIAYQLSITTRTIAKARNALVRSGDIVPYEHKPERPEGARGRRPNLYVLKEQGTITNAA